MSKFLRFTVIISGILVIIIPVGIIYLWGQYVKEQQAIKTAVQVQGCTPYQFKVDNTPGEKLSVSWQTRESCTGVVLLSPNAGDFSSKVTKVFPFTGSNATTQFSFQIPRADLKAYPYMAVSSQGTLYGIDQSAVQIASLTK